MLKFYSPNGQRGCLWVRLWHLHMTLGFTPSTWGFDISWREHMLFAIPGRQKLTLLLVCLLVSGCHAPTAPSGEPIASKQWTDVPRVYCESGSEFREQSREGDPYYVHTMACTADDANGKPVWVVVID